MTIRLQLSIAFLVLIALFIVDFFVTQRLSQAVQTNMNYISNSEAIIRNSNLLHKNIIEMQSGFRGYLLTDQQVFLQNYHKGLRNVPNLFRQQRQLISNERQHDRLDSIEALHRKWIVYSNSLIAARQDTVSGHEQRYRDLFEKKLKMEVGKKLNDQIEQIFLAFDTYEYNVRAERRTALQDSIISTRNLTLVLTLTLILLALISSYFFIRNITSRIEMMVNLAEKISRGNFKILKDDRDDELKRLSESLNSMSRTLEKNFRELTRKNKELDQFAYVVSHDLKAPLRGISNITTWMEEDHPQDLTPAIRNNLELIKGRTSRLENMINGLLAYARVGKSRKSYETVSVKVMLQDLFSLLVPKSFSIQLSEPLPVFETEKLLLEHVFSNIISNAVKYNNREHGLLAVSARELPDAYEFTVSDNGPGIQEDYFEKIFMIFQTLQERDAFESTGVGLAIVKKIIDDQKATIQVRSVFGQGTAFIFTWPKKPSN
jgi:signal transduction histidine kinase